MANMSIGLRHMRCRTALSAAQWRPTLAFRPAPSSIESRRHMTVEPSPKDNKALIPASSGVNAAAASIDAIQIPYQGVSHAREVPATPSYFTRQPQFNDLFVKLMTLLAKYHHLPTSKPNAAPQQPWMRLESLRQQMGEPIKAMWYSKLLRVAKRLNMIEPSLRPEEVNIVIQRVTRIVKPLDDRPQPLTIDKFGRAVGSGRRKASTARAFVVEGNGEFLVNGRPLHDMFGRVHDRESAAWALMATQRLDKYNVWALVSGGGVTGQAEALTLAVAKALLAHEPALKPALRKAGCITRDSRTVERKKHGKLKARKGPAWVKR